MTSDELSNLILKYENKCPDHEPGMQIYYHPNSGYQAAFWNKDGTKVYDTMEEDKMESKILRVKVWCQAYYETHIKVPVDMTLDEAIEYAKDHIMETAIEDGLEYVPDSDEVDEENCYFV